VNAAVYVDAAYASIAARELGGALDFVRLRSYLDRLASPNPVTERWWFDALDGRFDKSTVHAAVRRAGFRLELTEIRSRPARGPGGVPLFMADGSEAKMPKQVGIDTLIVDTMVRHQCRNGVMRIILVAGDCDFTRNVKRLVDLQNEVIVMAHAGSVDAELCTVATQTVFHDAWAEIGRPAPSALYRPRSVVSSVSTRSAAPWGKG